MKFIYLLILLFFITLVWGQSEKKFNNIKTTLGVIDNYKEPVNKDMFTRIEIAEILSNLNNRSETLPTRVDNSFSKYSRPIFSQVSSSCGSASRICYMFAHEINAYRKLDGSLPENKYPSHFTWLLTGQNSKTAEIAKSNGIPNSVVYQGETYSTKYGGENVTWPNLTHAPDYGWMQGYDSWYEAMSNRLESNKFLKLDTPENLLILKSWLYNHHGDTSFAVGGIAGGSVPMTNSKITKISTGEETGKYIITKWGNQIDHGICWVGYDDKIAYDFNGDGKFTNDIDISGNGIVDLADWEIGAFIMLNSWGSDWGNDGTIYVPYRLLKFYNMDAEFYHIRKDHKPRNVMKISMSYPQRNKIQISVGIAQGHTAATPSKYKICHHFNYAGNGDVPLLGRWNDGIIHDEAMEFAYDLSDLADLSDGYSTKEPHTFFLKILSKYSSIDQGKIHSVSVIDYSTDPDGIEYKGEVSEISIKGNGQYTYVAVRMPGNKDGLELDYFYVPKDLLKIKYCSSQQTTWGEDGKAENILDNDLSTYWQTKWLPDGTVHPHEVQIDLGKSYSLKGLEYWPRQDYHGGRIKDYEIYLSEDGTNWGTAVKSGSLKNSSKKSIILFDQQSARFIKIVALSDVGGGRTTSIAEINVLQVSMTSVKEIKDDIMDSYSLSQNYPNPFNPETTIEFHIPISGQVKIEILNLLGEKIKTLLDETKPAGIYKVEFNGKDLSSGIYLYKISTDDWSETKKMILLK